MKVVDTYNAMVGGGSSRPFLYPGTTLVPVCTVPGTQYYRLADWMD